MSSRAGLVVVGGGPAGHAAATAYAEAGGPGPVVLLADEGRHPYERPPLSKDLLRGTTEAGALPLEDDPAAYAGHGVEVRHAEAVGLDPAAREVLLGDGGRLGFGACVLATGGRVGADALEAGAVWAARVLTPGGRLVAVHWTGTADDLRTDAATVAATLRARPDLRDTGAGDVRDGYRLDVLERRP